MLYEHTNYRRYLKQVLADRAAHDPKYSLRAMARHLELTGSQLCNVLKGQSNLSCEMAVKVARKFKLDDDETEYFCDLVLLETFEDPDAKEIVRRRMKRFRASHGC